MAAKLIGNMEECDEKQQRNHRSVPPPPRLHPWLMFIYGKNKRNQTFYSLSENCVHIKSIPSMRRKIYAGSYFGWMILLSEFDSDGSFLLNPVSMEKIQLPPWGNFKHRSCLLLSPPNDPHCLILFLEAVGLGHASFRFCKPGDTVWFHQDLKIGKEEVVIEIVFSGGRIYAHLSSPGRNALVNFDIGKDYTIIMGAEAIPVIPFLGGTLTCYRLLESNGEVFFVTFAFWGARPPVDEHIRDITIQKMDFCKKRWVEVENIGDRAFFIGPSCCISCPAKELGIQSNTIYFTMYQDRSLYAFDLEEKSLTVTLPCPDVKNNWSCPDWVFFL